MIVRTSQTGAGRCVLHHLRPASSSSDTIPRLRSAHCCSILATPERAHAQFRPANYPALPYQRRRRSAPSPSEVSAKATKRDLRSAAAEPRAETLNPNQVLLLPVDGGRARAPPSDACTSFQRTILANLLNPSYLFQVLRAHVAYTGRSSPAAEPMAPTVSVGLSASALRFPASCRGTSVRRPAKASPAAAAMPSRAGERFCPRGPTCSICRAGERRIHFLCPRRRRRRRP